MTIKEIQNLIIKQAEEKGFGTKPEDIDIAEKMLLLHSEISEAYEAYRHKNIKGKDGFEEELGDVMQRLLHLCAVFNVDIEEAVLKKIENNKDREWDWQEMNEKHS